jgi:hypothetical protein
MLRLNHKTMNTGPICLFVIVHRASTPGRGGPVRMEEAAWELAGDFASFAPTSRSGSSVGSQMAQAFSGATAGLQPPIQASPVVIFRRYNCPGERLRSTHLQAERGQI